MNNLEIYKSEKFQELECDFWKNENDEIFMTSEQLGMVLGFSNPSKGISNLINRENNVYLKSDNFSATLGMRTPSGIQETRIFNEDGIYEIAFLAKTERAKEFRNWVRNILKGLRKGEIQLLQKQLEESKPKIELYNQCISAENYFSMLQVAKILKMSGRNKIYKTLREEGILMSKGERHNLPYQIYIDQKYFTVVVKPMIIGSKIIDISITLVSARGLNFIQKLLTKKKDLLKQAN